MNEQLSVPSFMIKPDKKKAKRDGILAPILVKVLIIVFMVTVAMILIHRGQRVLGCIIYGKEVMELIVFVFYMVRRRSENGEV
jgi:hypothetical protein